jgi:hypothetical protein
MNDHTHQSFEQQQSFEKLYYLMQLKELEVEKMIFDQPCPVVLFLETSR